jgi:histone H3/H4
MPPQPPPEAQEEASVAIPQQLLQRLLQEFFEEKKTRISQPALNAVGEYTKTFIREAIWRAAAIRKDNERDPGAMKNMSAFLEVCLRFNA